MCDKRYKIADLDQNTNFKLSDFHQYCSVQHISLNSAINVWGLQQDDILPCDPNYF